MDNKKLIELVKKMRAEMGLGIMEIKSALEEAKGDEKKAKEILKKKGFEKAKKKAEREIKAGRVFTYTHSTGTIGVIVELLCETDFVAKNEEFMAVGRDIALQVAAMNPKNDKELLNQDYIKDGSMKVNDLIVGLVAKFGENIKLGRFERFEL
jgi:elongation factor Ts